MRKVSKCLNLDLKKCQNSDWVESTIKGLRGVEELSFYSFELHLFLINFLDVHGIRYLSVLIHLDNTGLLTCYLFNTGFQFLWDNSVMR